MSKLFKKKKKYISFDEAALSLDDGLNPGGVIGAGLHSLRAQHGCEPGHYGRHQEVQSDFWLRSLYNFSNLQSVVEGPFDVPLTLSSPRGCNPGSLGATLPYPWKCRRGPYPAGRHRGGP